MKTKWHFLIAGFLIGILISGISFLIFSTFKKATKEIPIMKIISPTIMAESSPSSIKNVSKIDLNNCDLQILMTLPNIGETKARAIIQFRDKYGDFENINELLYVPGIGESVFDSLEQLVFVR